MQTAGTFSQDTPFSDGQFYLGATYFTTTVGTTAAAAFVSITGTGGTASILGVASSSTGASTRESTLTDGVMLRTGIYAPSTAQTLSGQAFGTAALLPGPQAAVAGTSSPSGFGSNQVIPPVLKANLPTLKGSTAGARPKGVQINWVDILFTTTGTVASMSVTLKRLVAAPGVAAIPTVAVDMNAVAVVGSLATTTANQISRVRATNANAAMMTGDTTVIDLAYNYNIAAGVVTSLGVVLGCSYNYN